MGITRPISRRGFVALAGTSVAVLAAGSLAACGQGGSSSSEKVLRYGTINPKASLDQQITTGNGTGISQAVCEPLVWFDQDFKVQPLLVTQLPVAREDKVTYDFELKENVKFHDGSTLTADDVKFTFERMFTPATKAASTNSYELIVGAKDMLAGTATELSGFAITDDRHFSITLEQPYASFLAMLAEQYAVIYPRKACTEAGSNWGNGTNYVGTGPYKLTSNDDATEVVLEAFSDYHDGAPKVAKIECRYVDDVNTLMMNYKSGDIDLCVLDPSLYDQYADDTDVKDQIVNFIPAQTRFVNLNLNDDALKDVRVREALSLAINRQELVDTVLQGASKACTQFVAPGEEGYDDSLDVLEYNPDKARQLLEEAGATGTTLTLATQAKNQKVAVALQGYWQAVGLNVQVNQMDNSTYMSDRTAGNLQMSMVTWLTLCWIGSEHMRSWFHSSRTSKRSSFYASQAFDTDIDAAQAELDEAARIQLTREADATITRQDFACIAVDYPGDPYVARNVSGMFKNPLFAFTNAFDVEAEK